MFIGGFVIMKTYDGVIEMSFIRRGERTIAERIYRDGNSRISAFIRDTGITPVYFLITTGGGFIEGECYYQLVKLGEDTHTVLTSQTPNYIYKCPRNLLTKQDIVMTIGENATLECYLDEIIPYEKSCYFQKMTVSMAKGSSFILTDGLTSGWSQEGRPFQYRYVGIKTTIFKEGEILLNDYLICDTDENNMKELGYFEGYTNFNSIIIIDEQITDSLIEEFQNELDESQVHCRHGLTRISNGLIVRILGKNNHDNRQLVNLIISYYRENIRKFNPINLRKTDFQLK